MAAPGPEKNTRHFGGIVSDLGTASDPSSGSNEGLHIPISDDNGFYEYNDEKSLQHVSLILLFTSRPRLGLK